MQRWLIRSALALLSLAIALPCFAQGRIVFTRALYNPEPNPTLRSSTLYSVNDDGTGFRQLAPMTAGVYRLDPRWSPSGNSIAYVYGTPGGDRQLWRMDANGANRTRISWGAGDHMDPAWRPDGGMIAFIRFEPLGGSCLALVRPNGTGQRDLFCPPERAFFDNRPRWSLDGLRLFVTFAIRLPGLEPPYDVFAYSIDPATGAATLLTQQRFEDYRRLVIDPTGTRALVVGGGDIDAVDFATDMVVPRTEGGFPLWSKRGSRFAYEKETFTDSAIYTHVWIMSADGLSDYEIPMPIADGLWYSPVEFSRDGTRLLTNRGTGEGVAIRMFDIATGAWTRLPEGFAEDWWQPAP